MVAGRQHLCRKSHEHMRSASKLCGWAGGYSGTSRRRRTWVHGVYKQKLRLNWHLKATSIAGAQFLQTKRAAKLGPQSDLKLGCTVFAKRGSGSTGTSKRPQSPVHSFCNKILRFEGLRLGIYKILQGEVSGGLQAPPTPQSFMHVGF